MPNPTSYQSSSPEKKHGQRHRNLPVTGAVAPRRTIGGFYFHHLHASTKWFKAKKKKEKKRKSEIIYFFINLIFNNKRLKWTASRQLWSNTSNIPNSQISTLNCFVITFRTLTCSTFNKLLFHFCFIYFILFYFIFDFFISLSFLLLARFPFFLVLLCFSSLQVLFFSKGLSLSLRYVFNGYWSSQNL